MQSLFTHTRGVRHARVVVVLLMQVLFRAEMILSAPESALRHMRVAQYVRLCILAYTSILGAVTCSAIWLAVVGKRDILVWRMVIVMEGTGSANLICDAQAHKSYWLVGHKIRFRAGIFVR